MRYFAVLFALLATHTIDAREPWPPKDGLGKDLPKELSAAYWFVSDADPRKFPYPDEVQTLFYDFDVRIKFWFMVGRMMQIAKRGNGKVLPEDEAKLKATFEKFLLSLFSNKYFARMPESKQNQVSKGMRDFATIEITGRIIMIHSLNETVREAKRQKEGR